MIQMIQDILQVQDEDALLTKLSRFIPQGQARSEEGKPIQDSKKFQEKSATAT